MLIAFIKEDEHRKDIKGSIVIPQWMNFKIGTNDLLFNYGDIFIHILYLITDFKVLHAKFILKKKKKKLKHNSCLK